jgi:uncharacterized protein YecT (DUF1311 family)
MIRIINKNYVGGVIELKNFNVIVLTSLIVIIMVGYGNSISSKAIEQGKLAMASKEYDKALASFQLAIDEGSKDKEVLKITEIIEMYKKASNLFNEGNIERSEKIVNEINEEYVNYLIKDDIDTLKKLIKDKQKANQEIASEIESLNKYFEEKNYDEANNLINSLEGKNLTDEQISQVNEVKTKIQEIKANNKQTASTKNVYLQKLKKIEDEVSNIIINGDTLSMKAASYEEFKKWDDALNEIYGVLKSQLSSSEMSALKEEQITWIAIRDASAEASSYMYKGGTMYGLVYTEALATKTRERCYELVNYYMN